jgi:hypothetical protein
MPVTPRKLVFFVIDDSDLNVPETREIEIWHPEWEDGPVNGTSVSTWLQHVQQTYRDKEISFDGLSIDVNFSGDGSDPAWSLNPNPPADICSGLYHGLVALARRRANDANGNALPCAWEVRTVTPGMSLPIDQEVEVARIYAMLLALGNPYNASEGFLGLGDEGDKRYGARVLKAFRAQSARSGGAIDMIVNLLPQWRDKFVDAVEARRVRIDVEPLKSLQADLQRAHRKKASPDAGFLDHKQAVITLLDRDRVACEAIQLSSIFADRDVVTEQDYEAEVKSWIDRLVATSTVDLAGYVDSTVRWIAAVAHYVRHKELPEDAPQLRQRFIDLDVEHRMLIIISYHIAATLDSKRFRPADLSQLAAALVYDGDPFQCFGRLLKGTKALCSVTNITQLRRDVLGKLDSPKLNLRFAPTLCQALANVLYESDLEDQVRSGFPTLVPYLELGG